METSVPYSVSDSLDVERDMEREIEREWVGGTGVLRDCDCDCDSDTDADVFVVMELVRELNPIAELEYRGVVDAEVEQSVLEIPPEVIPRFVFPFPLFMFVFVFVFAFEHEHVHPDLAVPERERGLDRLAFTLAFTLACCFDSHVLRILFSASALRIETGHSFFSGTLESTMINDEKSDSS